MSGECNNISRKYVVFIGRSLLVGLGSGFFLLIISCAWSLIWEGLTIFNWNLSGIMEIQWMALLLLVLVLNGVLSAKCNVSRIKTEIDAGVAGFFAGVGTSAVFLLLPLYTSTLMPLNLSYWDTHALFSRSLVLMIIVVLQFIALSAIGALLHFYSETKKMKFTVTKKISGSEKKQIPTVIIILALLLCITALLPPAVVIFEIKSGFIERIPVCCYVPQVSVERLGEESIIVKNLEDAGPDLGWLVDNYFPFKILINGRDVSDSDAIRHSGLSVTIDPPDGLGYKKGSLIVLTGNDLRLDNGSIHLEVVSYTNQRLPEPAYNSWI